MEAGVHLPQCAFDGQVADATKLTQFVDVARELGFAAIAANDHFAFTRPWLDGPTLLAAVAGHAGDMDLATTIALPALRGPAPLAAALATLDVLAHGRVVAGIGPGSSRTDYALARFSFADRWTQFVEAASTMRALLSDHQVPSIWSDALPLDQRPATSVASGPIPLWIASWGSAAGMRRVIRLGDGWVASAYHASVEDFIDARRWLDAQVRQLGHPRLPCAVATMWTYVTDDAAVADRLLRDVLAPALGRDPEQLRARTCIGPVEVCQELLARYREAGCDRIYLWPIADEIEQLQRIATELLPRLSG
jgi:alkanesulfonate monooxygenase SsuD/methylene tetrahydromethanopterin reductase-like flavin-dependent oxidoreductase (luciferase family)